MSPPVQDTQDLLSHMGTWPVGGGLWMKEMDGFPSSNHQQQMDVKGLGHGRKTKRGRSTRFRFPQGYSRHQEIIY